MTFIFMNWVKFDAKAISLKNLKFKSKILNNIN